MKILTTKWYLYPVLKPGTRRCMYLWLSIGLRKVKYTRSAC